MYQTTNPQCEKLVYWKIRAEVYLQSLGVDVWEIVEGGYQFPIAIPTESTCKYLYKTNAKVVNTLFGSLSESEFVKVMQLNNQRDMGHNHSEL